MPDPEEEKPEFKLTEAETEIALAWLKTHLIPRGCPVCEKKKFKLETAIMEIRSLSGGNYVSGRFQYFPTLVAACDNCGHLVLFNAKKVGIRTKSNKEESGEDG